MPAIDRARLALQTARVADAAGDPEALRRRFRDLMEFYADRTRRLMPDSDGYGAPLPVLKAQASALAERATTSDQAALLADVLWSMEFREARLVAAKLIRGQPPDDILYRILAWAGTTRDPLIMAELAGPSLGEARRRAPATFLQTMMDGCRAATSSQRSFALRALADAAADRSFQALPDVLEVLSRGVEAPVGDEARSLTLLVVALARRTPGETARVLRDALDRRQPWAYRLAAAAMPELPERTQASLQRSLSASRAAGIIASSVD